MNRINGGFSHSVAKGKGSRYGATLMLESLLKPPSNFITFGVWFHFLVFIPSTCAAAFGCREMLARCEVWWVMERATIKASHTHTNTHTHKENREAVKHRRQKGIGSEKQLKVWEGIERSWVSWQSSEIHRRSFRSVYRNQRKADGLLHWRVYWIGCTNSRERKQTLGLVAFSDVGIKIEPCHQSFISIPSQLNE